MNQDLIRQDLSMGRLNAAYLRLDGGNTSGTEVLGDILYFDGTQWQRLARPTGPGTSQLVNTSAGAISWQITSSPTTPSWSSVLVAGRTSGATNPQLTTTSRLELRDSAIYLYSSVDGRMDAVADGSIVLTAPTVHAVITDFRVGTALSYSTLRGNLLSLVSSSSIVFNSDTLQDTTLTATATTSRSIALPDIPGTLASLGNTSAQTFTGEMKTTDNIKFYIGDNSATLGNVSLQNDQFGTGNFLINSENGFSGEIYTDISTQITGNLTAANQSHTTVLVSFGAALASAIVTPSVTSDILSVRKSQANAGTAIRGMIVQAEWAGSATNSSNINGFNSFAYTATSATGALTATANGGGLRNRNVVRHRATNAAATVALMSALSTGTILDANTATVTEARSNNVESPSLASGSTLSTWKGLNFESSSISGTMTTGYFIFVPSMSFGTNRYEVWMDTDAGLFFRAAAQTIYSSATDVLNVVAGKDVKIDLGSAGAATNVVDFAAAAVTLVDAYNVVVGSTTGTKIATATTQKLGFWNATPVVRPSAYTQTYSTADKTLGAYTSDAESAAYTGIDNAQVGTVYATVADLNQLRVAYETLRAFTEDAVAMLNAVVDDLQTVGLVG